MKLPEKEKDLPGLYRKIAELAREYGMTNHEFREEMFIYYAAQRDSELEGDPYGYTLHQVTFDNYALVTTSRREYFH